jgi:hypothetical protein
VVTTQFDAAASGATTQMATRVNGVAASGSGTSVNIADGNFGTYPWYIGRRGASAVFPLNGNLYGLIVRFSSAALAAGVIGNAEAWMNDKTGAY